MELTQDLVTHHDGADGFAFTASACHGTTRLRATGRRTLAADHHGHQLHIHLILDYHDRGGAEHARRTLRSGSVAEFLDMHLARRPKVVACIVSRARFPPGCADVVERFCARAAACGRQKLCDDVTVTVDRRQAEGSARPGGDAAGGDAGADLPSFIVSGVSKWSPFWFLGCLEPSRKARRIKDSRM